MDFLEIRKKAKERAAARAAAAARPPAGAGPEEVRRPLALEPLPLPPVPPPAPPPSPVTWSPTPEPEPASPEPWLAAPPEEPAVPEPAAPEPDPEAARLAEAAAAEAARLEAELEARLREMPAAGDGRFLTWRPSGGAVPALEPIAPEPAPADQAGADEAAPAARPGHPGRRRGRDAPAGEAPAEAWRDAPPGDPLDEFFYRTDEAGPALGALAPQAEVAAAPAEVVPRVEYLTFRLGAEEYGVEIDRVREVMRSPPITEVPRAPADVLGVITVRGEVVAVFDPRARLGLPRGEAGGGGRVIIVDDGAGACGLLVDGVASVVRLPRGSIEPCPQGIGGASADCLEGIGRDHDRLFTVLSVGALLKPVRRADGRGG